MSVELSKCFICLEESSNASMKRLCQTCMESTICQRCETVARGGSNPDILSLCPICRTSVGEPASRTKLISIWHPAMILFWWWWGVKIPFWQQTVVSLTSYEYVSRACRTINETADNSRPSMLLKRWNILNKLIHIPYFIYVWNVRENIDDQGLIDSYIASHILGPLSILVVLKFFFRIIGMEI